MAIHFEWTKEISVGNETLDNQHQKLLSQINKILDAIVLGVDAKEVKDNMMNYLSEYIEEHLLSEEEYMKSINYPDLDSHIKKHRNFIKKYFKFHEEFKSGADKDKLLSDIESYIGGWWINHISHEDKKYYLYLEEKNNK